MNWFASLFSGNGNSARKGQAMHSTHEAFSIPTSSPVFSSHNDAFATDGSEPYTAASASYTYPPQSPYGYTPTSSGLGTARPNSLLPLHNSPLHSPMMSHPRYPPLEVTWNRLKTWLAREYPELGDTLNYGILPQDLAELEAQFGFALPPVIRESYLTVDGQEAESAAGCAEGLFFGLTLLPLEDVFEEWRFWREVDDDPTTGSNAQLQAAMQSFPSGYIRLRYSQRGWIPLIKDKAGNYIGIDLNPDEKGAIGQVIVFGRDFDTKVVLWNGDGTTGWAKWLSGFADELESGDSFEVGNGNDSNEGSEDDLGYESYYYDGTGRGQGDGGVDTNSGLRLTGEYRGWNAIEALADRSVRRWYDSGIVPPPSDPEKPQIPDILIESDSAVNVPAPDHAPLPSTSATPSTTKTVDAHSRKPHPNLPTISVTKPPAPLPVALPTPRDIDEVFSPPGSERSSLEGDLESGRRPSSARQMSGEMEAMVPHLDRQDTAGSLDDMESNRTGTPLASTGSTPVASPQAVATTQEAILIDTATTPDEPSTPLVDSPSHQENALEPEPTIRLVGGASEAFLVDTNTPEEEEEAYSSTPEPETTASEPPVEEPTSDGPKAGEKTHKKTKSGLAGLKKSLNGLRKKDSVSSVKDIAAAESKP